MWSIFVNFLIGVAASVIYAALSYRKPTDTIEAEDEVGYPKAEEGSEIGKVFGTVWVNSPSVVWHGDLAAQAIVAVGPRRYGLFGPKSRTTTGYKYSYGVHFVPCLGPVDTLLQVNVQEKRAWRGNAKGLPANGDAIDINDPELFGGEKREGGIVGRFNFLGGYATQGRNNYLQGILGSDIPAWRGVTSVILRRMYLGTSAYLKPWAFKIQRVFVGDGGATQWEDDIAGLSRGLAFRNAAVYVAFDGSGSMAGSKWEAQISALSTFLAAVRDNNDPAEPNDFLLRRFGSGATTSARDMVAADYDAMIAWLAAQVPPIGGTNFLTGMELAEDFFASVAPSKSKVVIFLTDGEPTAGFDESVAIAESLWAAGVDIYGFNIELTNTTATAALDNTPDDGVPVIAGGDADAIIRAFLRVFSLGFDMNPAHILREVLIARDTNGSGDASEIGPTFAVAAQTLYDEGFGLSLFWRNPSDKVSFIKEVEAHIDAKIYQDRRTGLWELKLIRADYDAATLPVFDRTNVVEWADDIEWPDPSNLPNQVTVVYTDPGKDEPGSITLTNPARVQALGRVINRKAEFLGITSSVIAARVASRELTSASAPLLSGTIRVRFVDPSLNLGSPIKLHNPALGIEDVVVRIIELIDGDGRQNAVTIRFVEDRFTLPTTALVRVENIATEATRPQPATTRLVEEAPYYVVADEVGQSELDTQLTATPGLGWLSATAVAPTASSLEIDIWRDAGAGYLEATENGTYCPHGVMRSNLSMRADHTKIIVDAAALVDIDIGSLALIGSEYVRVDSIVTPGTWTAGDYWEPPVTPTGDVALVTIGRGCLDTSPREHAAGAVVLFWQGYAVSDDTAYNDADSVDVKLRTVAATGLLSLAETPVDTVTFSSRAIRPYPPGRVQIGASYAMPTLWSGTLSLTWAHRDRKAQTTPPIADHTAASIGPEAGTTYRVRAWALNIDGNVYGSELLNIGGISGTSQSINTATYPAPAGAWGVRVEVQAERGGYTSTRNGWVDVPVAVTPAMLRGGTWLDVNDIGSLFQNADGTTAVTADGQPIGLIENQKGSIA